MNVSLHMSNCEQPVPLHCSTLNWRFTNRNIAFDSECRVLRNHSSASHQRVFLLPNTAKATPDALSFLAKAGRGRTVIEFEQDKNIFEQGDAADVVYYIHEGKIKLTVLSAQGKEAVVGI